MQYSDLDKTWAQVKDSLLLPVKTRLCKAAGRALPLSLLLLPAELRDRCLQQLQAGSSLLLLHCMALHLTHVTSVPMSFHVGLLNGSLLACLI